MKPAEGSILAIASATLFGAATVAAKALLGDVTPFMLAGILYLGSGLGLGIFFIARLLTTAGWNRSIRLSRSDYPWFAGAIVCGGILAPLLLMWGLMRIPASTTSLLLNLEGVLTVLFAWAIFKENIGHRILLGLIAIIAGSVLLSFEPLQAGEGSALGTIAVVAACLCWAVDNNLTRRISAGNPIAIASIKGLTAGAVNLTIAMALGQTIPRISIAALAGLAGLIGYGASLILFILALRALGTARTGVLFSTAPFIGASASLLFLGERINAMLLPAAVLMGVGLWLQLGEKHFHDHVHKTMTHDHSHKHDEHHLHDHEELRPGEQKNSHLHHHMPQTHVHTHYPDIHHRHRHDP